ncbi:MAG: amidohydrolase family protein, partial [Acidobacteria bacterium]|nr:amidohydrolase family protein [Acidobacteriota bacterium]
MATMKLEVKRHIENLCLYLNKHRHNLTIDADAHATDIVKYPRRNTPHYYHGRPLSSEELIEEMNQASVSMANIWQNPAATTYINDSEENYQNLLEANNYIHQSALNHPIRFIPSGWTDPKACGVPNACRIAEQCVAEFGFLIVKMNPAQNQYPIDSPAVIEVLDCIVELGAIPAFHYGADSPYTPASGLATIARRHPNHPVLAVHMGGGGAGYVEAENQYQQSRELGLQQTNIHSALSALRATHIESNIRAYQGEAS